MKTILLTLACFTGYFLLACLFIPTLTILPATYLEATGDMKLALALLWLEVFCWLSVIIWLTIKEVRSFKL